MKLPDPRRSSQQVVVVEDLRWCWSDIGLSPVVKVRVMCRAGWGVTDRSPGSA